MLEPENPENQTTTTDTADAAPAKAAPRKRAARKAAPKAPAEPAETAAQPGAEPAAVDPAAVDPAAVDPAAVETAGGEAAPAPRKRAAKKVAGKPATKAATKAAKPTKKAAKAAPAEPSDEPAAEEIAQPAAEAETLLDVPAEPGEPAVAKKSARKAAAKTPRKRAAKKAAPATAELPAAEATETAEAGETAETAEEIEAREAAEAEAARQAPALAPPPVLFVTPAEAAPTRRRRAAKAPAGPPPVVEEPAAADADLTIAEGEDLVAEPEDVKEAAVEEATGARRRRRRGRRGRGGGGRGTDEAAEGEETADADTEVEPAEEGADGAEGADDTEGAEGTEAAEGGQGTRRRRRRRRAGASADDVEELPANTVVHVRQPREAKAKGEDDGVKAVKGSTRLEAKRQRRRDGRESGRRRPPILTEAEFLARREAVDRVMAVRQNGDRTQIAVLEDDILVEHYVTRASATSYVGNVYLGRVQNVLPSMEAAFVDIGKGRNGVLYAGEVNWDAAGLEGKSRAIEQALKSGDTVLVQVTKDPIGHKGARLTSQVSLPGRFLVYVPGGGMTGISRKLPDTERHRLKAILKKIVPEDAGVIIRTAAEGASEEDLTRDVERLKAQWEKIAKKAEKTSSAPTLVHGEPDLAIRVVRDVFNEDFKKLVVQGEGAWQTVSEYIENVAPDLRDRVAKHVGTGDLFHDLRVDEQLMKALDRKVWLPSGGSLVIDRTEAMTVIDVNTGKFVGSGGNLEQTVTRNNLEAAEEIVRQLRLRDVGGIVVIDFIDMVLESNRDLVLRRLTECLGRDRTKHQVAEVTSLGLVQMTRKRVGEGLIEAFSDTCEHCKGRGVIVHSEPVDQAPPSGEPGEDGARGKRKRGKKAAVEAAPEPESPEEIERRRAAAAAIAAIHRAAHPDEYQGEGPDEPETAPASRGGADGGPAADSADAAAELELAAVAAVLDAVPIDDEYTEMPDGSAPVEVALPEPAEATAPEPAAEPSAEAEPVVAELEPVVADAQPVVAEPAAAATAPVGSGRPRRRRAASRPAGPPVHVQG